MIYLLRHGRDDEKFLGGWSDNELTSEGKQMVRDAALRMLKDGIKVNKIICSPIRRAHDSALIAAEVLGIDDVVISNNLMEQNKGLLNGMNKEIANQEYPEYLVDNVDTVYPEGESLRQLHQRILGNLDFFKNLEDGTLLITHRGVINTFYYYMLNKPIDMDKKQFKVGFATLHELDFENNNIRKIF